MFRLVSLLKNRFMRQKKDSETVIDKENNQADQTDTVDINSLDVDENHIEAVSPEEIMLWQKDLIDKIKSFLGLSNVMTDKYLMPVIRNYIDYVHLLPASENHHHAGVGGLVIHGLETCLYAVRYSESSLPYTGLEPSFKKKYEIKWRLAVAIAALLHDVAKAATDVIVTNEKGLDWLPFSESLSGWLQKNKVHCYYITYRQKRFKKHEDYAITIARKLIPDETMRFIEAGNAAGIVYKLFAALNVSTSDNEDPSLYDIRDLVIKADQFSAEKDMSSVDKTDTISRGLPLDGYFLSVIRKLTEDKIWSFNNSDSQMFFSDTLYLGEKCLYIDWSRGAFSRFYELIENMPEIHGVPRNIKKLATYLFDRNCCAGTELHFRILLQPGFVQADVEKLDSAIKENLQLPPVKRKSVKEIMKGLELTYIEVLPFSRPDLIFGAIMPSSTTLFFVEDTGVIRESSIPEKTSADITEKTSELPENSPEKPLSEVKIEQDNLPETETTSDDITSSLFAEEITEDYQAETPHNEQPQSLRTDNRETVTHPTAQEEIKQEIQPEQDESSEEASDEYLEEKIRKDQPECRFIMLDANGKEGVGGYHRTRISHVETDMDILTGKKKPPKKFIPNKKEYLKTYYINTDLCEKPKDNFEDRYISVLNRSPIAASIFAAVIKGEKNLPAKSFIQQRTVYGIRPGFLAVNSSISLEDLLSNDIIVKDEMGKVLTQIGNEDVLKLSPGICDALYMLGVTVTTESPESNIADVIPVITAVTSDSTTPEPGTKTEITEESESTSDDITMSLVDEADIQQPTDLNAALDLVRDSLFAEIRSNNAVHFRQINRIDDGQYVCIIDSIPEFTNTVNEMLKKWQYETDAAELTKYFSANSINLTRQYLVVTNLPEDSNV